MLAVLSHELTGLLPIVSKIDILCRNGPNEIQKLRENQFINLVDPDERSF